MSGVGELFTKLGVAINLMIPPETPALRWHTQRHIASVRRRDGHTIDGISGDCLRASVATALGVDDDLELNHYAMFRSWFNVMRIDARKRGLDWAYFSDPDFDELPLFKFSTSLASGPSPRGPFWHVVVVDHRGRMIHDPHPSRAGLAEHRDLFVLTLPYFPPPTFPELAGGQ